MSNKWNFAIYGGVASRINVTDGRVDIAGCTLNVSNLITATSREYVIIGYTPPPGGFTGQFAATNGLGVTWAIRYAGKAKHPSAVVLEDLQPPGSLFLVH